MSGRPGTPITNREPATDRLNIAAWQRPGTRRTGFDALAHGVGVAFLALLGLAVVVGVGVVVVIALASWSLSHAAMGPIDLTPPSANGMDIALSSDGTTAYVTEPTYDRLLVLDPATGTARAVVPVGADPAGVALSPDGTRVWVVNTSLASTSGSVTVVDTASDTVVGTVDVGSDPIDVAFSPDGRSAYVTDNGLLGGGVISVIDTSTLTVRATIAQFANSGSDSPDILSPTSVAVTPDGRELWVSQVDNLALGSAGQVTVFSTAFGSVVGTVDVGDGPFFLAFSPDGGVAYVADKTSCDVREIDTSTLRVLSTVAWPAADGCPFGIAAGPVDGTLYAVTGSDATYYEPDEGNFLGMVDFATHSVRILGSAGADPVTLALSPGGSTAYVVDADQAEVEAVDTTTGAVTGTLALPAPPTPTAPLTPAAPR